MTSKRQVLDALIRNELLAVVERYEMEVADRRVRDQLVDAAASSRRVVLADALAELSRDRLKEVCRALDLDDAGKEKSVLAARLLSSAWSTRLLRKRVEPKKGWAIMSAVTVWGGIGVAVALTTGCGRACSNSGNGGEAIVAAPAVSTPPDPRAAMTPDQRLAAARAACSTGTCDDTEIAALLKAAAADQERSTIQAAADQSRQDGQLAIARADQDALKTLKAQSTLTDSAGSKVQINGVSVARKWFFGSFGDGNMSNEADKGTDYVIVSFDISSKQKAPSLPCACVYLRGPQDASLTKVDAMEFQFRRWDSFGSMLGNYNDNGNDFAKSDRVKFSAAAQVELTDLASKYLYVVFAKAPTQTRHESSTKRPPVWYEGGCQGPAILHPSSLSTDFAVAEIRSPRSY